MLVLICRAAATTDGTPGVKAQELAQQYQPLNPEARNRCETVQESESSPPFESDGRRAAVDVSPRRGIGSCLYSCTPCTKDGASCISGLSVMRKASRALYPDVDHRCRRTAPRTVENTRLQPRRSVGASGQGEREMGLPFGLECRISTAATAGSSGEKVNSG